MGSNDSNVPIIKPQPQPFPSEPGGMAEPLWGNPVPTLREEIRALLRWLKVRR